MTVNSGERISPMAFARENMVIVNKWDWEEAGLFIYQGGGLKGERRLMGSRIARFLIPSSPDPSHKVTSGCVAPDPIAANEAHQVGELVWIPHPLASQLPGSVTGHVPLPIRQVT